MIDGDPRVGLEWTNTPIPGVCLPLRARWIISVSLVRVAFSVLVNRRWTKGRIERAGPPWAK
jgi:hypothetical protein